MDVYLLLRDLIFLQLSSYVTTHLKLSKALSSPPVPALFCHFISQNFFLRYFEPVKQEALLLWDVSYSLSSFVLTLSLDLDYFHVCSSTPVSSSRSGWNQPSSGSFLDVLRCDGSFICVSIVCPMSQRILFLDRRLFWWQGPRQIYLGSAHGTTVDESMCFRMNLHPADSISSQYTCLVHGLLPRWWAVEGGS